MRRIAGPTSSVPPFLQQLIGRKAFDLEPTNSWETRPVRMASTNRDERLVATGDQVVVRGRGGDDDVLVDEGWTTRVRGGDGDDRIYVEGDDVVVRGDAGADWIRLDGPLNYYLFGGKPVKTRQHVALGGRGPDVLIGSDYEVADRLVGGQGRDRANGRKGHRDYCLAEVTRRCERP